MFVAVVAMVVLVLAGDDPPSLVAWLMASAPKARAVARTVARHARRPRIGRVLAITDAPLRAVGPAMSAMIWIIDVPRWRDGHRISRRSE